MVVVGGRGTGKGLGGGSKINSLSLFYISLILYICKKTQISPLLKFVNDWKRDWHQWISPPLFLSLSLSFEPQMTLNKGIMDQIANLNSSFYQ